METLDSLSLNAEKSSNYCVSGCSRDNQLGHPSHFSSGNKLPSYWHYSEDFMKWDSAFCLQEVIQIVHIPTPVKMFSSHPHWAEACTFHELNPLMYIIFCLEKPKELACSFKSSFNRPSLFFSICLNMCFCQPYIFEKRWGTFFLSLFMYTLVIYLSTSWRRK